MQVQETQSSNYDGSKRPTLRHIIIKRPKIKDKDRLLKAEREKKLVTRWLLDGRGEGENG